MSNKKHCPHCHCSTVIKFGVRKGRQRYRCKKCGKVWQSKKQSQRLETKIWRDYSREDLKITQLCKKYNLGRNKIREIINNYVVSPIVPTLGSRHDVVCMDCTYFGRRNIDEWGLLIVVDAHTTECLYCEEIPGHETYAHYMQAINYLHNLSIYPKACVIDGVVGLAGVLQEHGILVQYCQFHQIKTVLTYITRNPVLEPNIELKRIVKELTHRKKVAFAAIFNTWYYRHQTWLAERTINPETHKLEYTHKRTRSAARSIQRNIDLLYTFEEHPDLHMPNTNNLMEGINSAIKNKLNYHRGARKALKTKLIREFLSSRTEV